jgi:tRNA modification GTPase
MRYDDSVTTYAACLTPPGSAAIAVIAVHGPKAWTITRALFRPAGSSERLLPESIEPPRFWYGKLTGDAADEVVLFFRRLQPVPSVEIHCHGGRQMISLILETLASHGVQVCSWQELERIGSDDPLYAEAVMALAEARTARTAAILLDQFHGALGGSIDAVLAALEQGDIAMATDLLESLVRYIPLGQHLTSPWRVVIAGAPNVGKSSLVNALAGYQRSIVSPVPGTTRDAVVTTIAIDGWPIELTDTAGLHVSGEDLEQQGMERARQAVSQADLCIWLLDAAAPPVWPDERVASPLLAVNKIDLPPVWSIEQAAEAVHVSALTGTGLQELCDSISRRLVPAPPPVGTGIPFTPEFCQRIEQAWSNCKAGRIEIVIELLAKRLLKRK